MKAKAVIPCLNYKDVGAAIEWLNEAFGFEKHLVVPGENGKIIHAELTLGEQVMIMLGPSDNSTPYNRMVKNPQDIGGFVTQSPALFVDDPDAFYARAKNAGAKILIDIKTEDYGGRGFTCADPEGHIWNFGSYDPWK